MLLQKGIAVTERDYFKEPLRPDELDELTALASLSELFAWRSPSLKQLGLAGQELGDAELRRLILEEPRLLRRPITRLGDRLIIGANLKALEAALE